MCSFDTRMNMNDVSGRTVVEGNREDLVCDLKQECLLVPRVIVYLYVQCSCVHAVYAYRCHTRT